MPGVLPLELPDNVPDCHRVIRELHAQVVHLVELGQAQAAEIARLNALCAEQTADLEQLRRELEQLKRQLYGQRRERFLGGVLEPPSETKEERNTSSDSFDPDSATNGVESESTPSATSAESSGKRRTSKGRRPRKINPLWPREKRMHRLRECDVPAEIWNNPDTKRFFRWVRDEIEIPDPSPKVIEHYQEVIVVENERGDARLRSAAIPSPLFDGCYVSPSFVAYLIASRFSDHIPYYRAEDILSRMGLDLHRSTQWRWMRTATRLLKPLVNLIRSRVRQSRVMGIDETPIPILCRERGTRKAYLYAQYGDASFPFVAYDFADHKAEENVRKIVGDYRGYMQSDAYICFELIAAASNSGILGVGCWAHARRKFEPLLKDEHPGATWILTRIAELYDIEDRAREMTDNERHALRHRESRPILERIASWLQERSTNELPKSPLRLGVNYLWSRWEMFTRFLEDGAIPIDNNRTEAMIKGPVIGKKNWLFFGNESAGETGADLFTITMTCKRHHINVQAYLTDVFQRIPAMKPDEFEVLLPDRWIEQNPQARVMKRVEESHAAARRKRVRRQERRRAAMAR